MTEIGTGASMPEMRAIDLTRDAPPRGRWLAPSLVAELDGEVVGFALGTIIDKPRSAWVYGYLVWFGVDDRVRGHGIGERLLRKLTDTFIHEGARMMLVDTDAENEGAIRFFTRNGFGNEQEHVYLSKNLTKHPEYERHRAREKSSKEHKARKPEPND